MDSFENSGLSDQSSPSQVCANQSSSDLTFAGQVSLGRAPSDQAPSEASSFSQPSPSQIPSNQVPANVVTKGATQLHHSPSQVPSDQGLAPLSCDHNVSERKRLSREFFNRDTVEVAKDLIGCELHRVIDGQHLVGRIVETEAYCGARDDACHSAKGRTNRTDVMFGPPGYAYVYLIYGTWNCLNVVTREEGEPEAILIRAVEPIQGESFMIERRGKAKNVADGPGKLCQAFAIDRGDNGVDLEGDELFFTEGPRPERLLATPRVGIDYAQSKNKLWRFLPAPEEVQGTLGF